MARFDVNDGAGKLSEDFQKLSGITNEDAWKILTPAGDHLAAKFAEKIRGTFAQHTGKLAASIKAQRKANDGAYIQVSPQGVHHQYNHPRRKKSRPSAVKNAHASEVAFVLEYGDGHHKATHWMENTINEEEAAIGEAMQQGFDAWCDERGV